MSFRRAFIAFAVSLGVPAVALAQDARQVEIGYEITFAGISGFRIDVTARFNGATYDVETSTFKVGTLKAMTMNYVGRNRAWGGFSPQGARPAAGELATGESVQLGIEGREQLVHGRAIAGFGRADQRRNGRRHGQFP